MAGTDGTAITNPTASETPSSYEVCQRSGFRVPVGTLIREWTGLWVRPEVWEARHPSELLRLRAHEQPHPLGNPEPDDTFIATAVSVDDL